MSCLVLLQSIFDTAGISQDGAFITPSDALSQRAPRAPAEAAPVQVKEWKTVRRLKPAGRL